MKRGELANLVIRDSNLWGRRTAVYRELAVQNDNDDTLVSPSSFAYIKGG